jgi:hypothetical protein
VAKRMLAEKLLHLGLAHPPRHKQEWLLNLESFTDIHRKSEETPNDSLSCRADGLNFHPRESLHAGPVNCRLSLGNGP